MAAGYSGTPLPKKLGIKEGHRVLLAHAPADFENTLGALPANVKLVKKAGKGPYDVLVVFVRSLADFTGSFDAMKAALDVNGGLWMAWPKKSSGIKTDITENHIRDFALENGLVDNKVCAVDETWSGLRLVYRLKDR